MVKGIYKGYELRFNSVVYGADLVLHYEWLNTYVLMPEDVDLFFFLSIGVLKI